MRPANTTAYEGQSLMMHCIAIGDPTPTVLWDKNNRVDALDFRRFKVSDVVAYWLARAFSALTLLVGQQEGHPTCKKTEWWGAGVVVCLERGADLHLA